MLSLRRRRRAHRERHSRGSSRAHPVTVRALLYFNMLCSCSHFFALFIQGLHPRCLFSGAHDPRSEVDLARDMSDYMHPLLMGPRALPHSCTSTSFYPPAKHLRRLLYSLLFVVRFPSSFFLNAPYIFHLVLHAHLVLVAPLPPPTRARLSTHAPRTEAMADVQDAPERTRPNKDEKDQDFNYTGTYPASNSVRTFDIQYSGPMECISLISMYKYEASLDSHFRIYTQMYPLLPVCSKESSVPSSLRGNPPRGIAPTSHLVRSSVL